MIDMDKMVEVAAEEIRSEGYNERLTGLAQGTIRIHPEDAAKAAIKAFCKELPIVPEVTFNIDGAKHTNIDVYELEDIYQALLEYGKDA